MAQSGNGDGLTAQLHAAVSAGGDLLVAAVGSTGGIDLVLLGDNGVQMLTGSLGGLEVEIDGDVAAGLAVALGGADADGDVLTGGQLQGDGVAVAVLGVVVLAGQLGAVGIVVGEVVLPVLTGDDDGHGAVLVCGVVEVVGAVAGQGNVVITLNEILGIVHMALGDLNADAEDGGSSTCVADLDHGLVVHQDLDHAVLGIVDGALHIDEGILAGDDQILAVEGIDGGPGTLIVVALQLVPRGGTGGDLDGVGGAVGEHQLHGVAQGAGGMLEEALEAQVDVGGNHAGAVPAVILDDQSQLIAALDLVGLVEDGDGGIVDGHLDGIAQDTLADGIAVVEHLDHGEVQGTALPRHIDILQILGDVVLAQDQGLGGLHIFQGDVGGVGVAIQRVHLNDDDLTGGDIELGGAGLHGLAVDSDLHLGTVVPGVLLGACAVVNAAHGELHTAVLGNGVNVGDTGLQIVLAQDQDVLLLHGLGGLGGIGGLGLSRIGGIHDTAVLAGEGKVHGDVAAVHVGLVGADHQQEGVTRGQVAGDDVAVILGVDQVGVLLLAVNVVVGAPVGTLGGEGDGALGSGGVPVLGLYSIPMLPVVPPMSAPMMGST